MKLIHSATIPFQIVNHAGSTVKKKVLIDNGIIPTLSKFSIAVFQPGESAPSHIHESMYEVYFVDQGSITFTVSSKKIKLQKGDCLIIEPNEPHAAINNTHSPFHLIYFGISNERGNTTS